MTAMRALVDLDLEPIHTGYNSTKKKIDMLGNWTRGHRTHSLATYAIPTILAINQSSIEAMESGRESYPSCSVLSGSVSVFQKSKYKK